MAKVKVVYGSTTGATEAVAQTIAAGLDAELINVAGAGADAFDADVVIIGCSTWGLGELQDDWMDKISLLDKVDLTGKKAAVFGTGDQEGFGDTFVDAIGILADKLAGRGATIIGATSTAGYNYTGSAADKGGEFCGLAIDDTNEADLTAGRVAAWVEKLKSEI